MITEALCRLSLSIAVLLVVACATPGFPGDSRATTPGADASVDETSSGRERAIDAYRDYLIRYPQSPEYESVARRLADLLVEQAADRQLAASTAPASATSPRAQAQKDYAEAIGHYEYLLQKDPTGPESTALLYQLSRAYEESGESQQALAIIDRLLASQSQADPQLYADTCFRQGELLFASGAYQQAGDAYQAVIDLGSSVPAYDQSLYKLGWSLYRQERYSEALPPLFAFLDRKVSPDEPYAGQIHDLSPADREQVGDLFHVISSSFAQLGGVESVDRYFRHRGERGYEEQVYLSLADWYVEQDQVSEAAGTWLVLVQRDPMAAGSPQLMARAIDLYRQAGFRQRAVALERQFVHMYGPGSEFWTVHAPRDFPEVMQRLESSLQQLALISHEKARETGNEQAAYEAEQLYRAYLALFGNEAAAAQMNFGLAELLYDNGRYREAVDEYEHTAWSRGEHPYAADAALGALQASSKLLIQAGPKEKKTITEHSTAEAIRFVQHYPEHPAAPDLLAQTGSVLLEQGEYDRALEACRYVVADDTTASPALLQMAWTLRAQVSFAQENYPVAASAYREALRLSDDGDTRRSALREGLAMSTYRQADQAQKRGDNAAAAALYQQAAKLAPDDSIRSKATYDAASALLAQASWDEAIRLLTQFRNDYPDDPLQQEVTRKLAYAYLSSGDHLRAAAEYQRLGEDRQQPEPLQRDALLQAARLYRLTGNTAQAIVAGERYVERFPEPSDIAVEQMQQLADLESTSGNAHRRRHWLEAIVSLDSTAGTSRTNTAAAEASLELAEYRLAVFRRIQLVSPVQDNLARKMEAMEVALQAFERAIDYGVPEVITVATHNMASIYEELAHALLTSERPAGLTPEELAEYDVLVAEQAEPFEQRAVEIYTANTRRSGAALGDPWVEKSALQLNQLRGGR